MLGALKQITIKNGEATVSASSTGTGAYYGGSPLALDSDGELVLCTSTNVANFIGIAAKSSYEDLSMTGARGVGTWYGAGLFRLTTFASSEWSAHATPTNLSGEGYPYDTTDNWNEGDSLYIDSNGLWVNADPGSQKAFGRVMAVGTNYLDIYLFGAH